MIIKMGPVLGNDITLPSTVMFWGQYGKWSLTLGPDGNNITKNFDQYGESILQAEGPIRLMYYTGDEVCDDIAWSLVSVYCEDWLHWEASLIKN